MLSVRPKITDLNFHLISRNIHPELFRGLVTRTIERDNYQIRLHITNAGHLIEFQHGGITLSEISTSVHHPVPSKRKLISHSARGENSDAIRYSDAVDYECTFQLESVPTKMFLSIQKQLDDQENYEGLLHRFDSNGRIPLGAVSYIDIQSFRSHVQVRCFHTFPDTCGVLKSQSKFTVLNPIPFGQ